MRDSLFPSSTGNRRGLLLLVGAGLAALLAAGAIWLLKHESPPAAEPPPPPPPAVSPAAPLVAPADPPPPIAQSDPDAGPSVLTEQKTAPTKKTRPASGPIGTIDAGKVNAFVNSRFAEVKACYERRLKTNPLLEGKLDLEISVTPTGSVSGIRVLGGSIRDSEMISCVNKQIRRWKFPRPDGGRVVIQKSFSFKKKM